MPALDLVIKGGRLVTADTEGTADIGIAGGIIVQIGGEMQADRSIDAAGKLVLPGGIDAHVHLSNPPVTDEHPWVDNFASGSAAALAGGITAIGNMTFPAPGELPLAALERESAVARDQTIADLFLHPVLEETSPSVLGQIPQLLDTGCNTVKIFMVSPQFDLSVPGYVDAIRSAGECGLLSMIHCEDHALIGSARSQLAAQGKISIRHYPESAPVVTESVAAERAVAIAELTGSAIYIVHVSSGRTLEVCAEAQSRGLPVYVETRPLYLHLTRERFEEIEGPNLVRPASLAREG